MHTTVLRWLGHSLVVAAAALSAGCATDAPVGPDQRLPSPSAARGGVAAAGAGNGQRAVDLGSCQNLQPPAGSKLVFHVYATGVQIYRWNGTGWSFVGPSAVLSADAGGNSTVGIHYAGPTWESVSGSTVRGAVLERCTPDPNAIPWLLLQGVAPEGPGIFHRVTYILRVNTVGGTQPTTAGSFIGEVVEVPYTAEYFFYRTK